MALYKYNILFIDPNDDFQSFINNFLFTTTSCQVMTCQSNEAALDILNSQPINMIIVNAANESQAIPFFEQVQDYSDQQITSVLLIDKIKDNNIFYEKMNDGLFHKFLTKPFEEIHLLLMAFESVNDHLKTTLDERIKMEEQFVHNEKINTLGQMMAGISHELNSPTTYIYSNLGNLKKFFSRFIQLINRYDDLDLPESLAVEINQFKEEINYDYLMNRIPRLLDSTAEGADRLKKILMDLKLFYRKDTEALDMADINATIESSINIIIHDYKDRIKINKEFSPLPKVECNITKINQVIVNILINACHAITETGEITIRTLELSDGMVQIEISDTGCGIPESVQKQIFQPFYTTKAGTLGSGLGLSISGKIIAAHKGKIKVFSEPGKGTTFTIILPIKKLESI